MELCGSFKPALIALLEAHPIKAIVMGQRRIDPDATTLEAISSSDVHRGWPEFLRINAILDWPYDAVWKFLLEFDLPYCSLYDLGYAPHSLAF
jgi:FAD synthetase